MRRPTALGLLASILVLALGGCPHRVTGSHGHVKPQMAVVAWLAAIDGAEFDRAAALAPPDISKSERTVLLASIAEHYSGVTRANKPFALSPPDHGKITARVYLDYPATGDRAVKLTLRKVHGLWYVVPPAPAKPAAKQIAKAPAKKGAKTPAAKAAKGR